MTDKEKEAIEKIKSFNQYNWEMNSLKGKEFAKPYFESLDTLLNLIKKQQKELEKLRNPVICGRTIEEVITILNALDIERETEIKMTMKNLMILFEKAKEEETRLMEEQIKNMFNGNY